MDVINSLPDKDLYDILMRATPEERRLYCTEGKFKAICDVITMDLHMALNPDFSYSFKEIKQIIKAFPDLDSAVSFLQVMRPALLYDDDVRRYIKKRNDKLLRHK